jgi:hypothetical protein
MKPFYKSIDEGMDPDAAWHETKAQVEKRIKYGTWATDFFVSGPDQSARFCHIDEIRCGGRTSDLRGPCHASQLVSVTD